MKVRTLICDDHQITRIGIRWGLSSVPDIEVIGEAEDGLTAVRLAAELVPDVVLLDVSMPGMNGVLACRQIRAESSRIHVLAFSMHSDHCRVRAMLEAGASGYLLKSCPLEELATAIRTVASGQSYLSLDLLSIAFSVPNFLHSPKTPPEPTLAS